MCNQSLVFKTEPITGILNSHTFSVRVEMWLKVKNIRLNWHTLPTTTKSSNQDQSDINIQKLRQLSVSACVVYLNIILPGQYCRRSDVHPPLTIGVIQIQDGCNSKIVLSNIKVTITVSFTDIELKFGVVVAKSDP